MPEWWQQVNIKETFFLYHTKNTKQGHSLVLILVDRGCNLVQTKLWVLFAQRSCLQTTFHTLIEPNFSTSKCPLTPTTTRVLGKILNLKCLEVSLPANLLNLYFQGIMWLIVWYGWLEQIDMVGSRVSLATCLVWKLDKISNSVRRFTCDSSWKIRKIHNLWSLGQSLIKYEIGDGMNTKNS